MALREDSHPEPDVETVAAEPAAEPVSGNGIAGSPLETALQCLVAVARHHGIDLSADRIKHDHALKPDDDVRRLLPKIARDCGMRTRSLRLRWKDLARLGDAYPTIARLANGNSVILL